MGRIAIWCLALSLSCAHAWAEGRESTVTLYYPDTAWIFRFDMPGVLEQYNNHKTGVSTYAYGSSPAQGMRVSADLSAAKSMSSAVECREFELREVAKNPAYGTPEIKRSERGGFAEVETRQNVPPDSGTLMVNRHRYWLKDR